MGPPAAVFAENASSVVSTSSFGEAAVTLRSTDMVCAFPVQEAEAQVAVTVV